MIDINSTNELVRAAVGQEKKLDILRRHTSYQDPELLSDHDIAMEAGLVDMIDMGNKRLQALIDERDPAGKTDEGSFAQSVYNMIDESGYLFKLRQRLKSLGY